jgi:hypothetical protein
VRQLDLASQGAALLRQGTLIGPHQRRVLHAGRKTSLYGAQSARSQRATRNYRELRGDRRLPLIALRRAVEVAWAFRPGFLAVVFLVALRALVGFVFVLVDRLVVGLFFFAGAAADFFAGATADFAFLVGVLVRFLAAPIAAPESAPITVPMTGAPSAVPATAPAAAPPRVLPAVPMAESVAP